MDNKLNAYLKIFLWGLTTFILVFMTACSTTHRKDGPPGFYVDETKIPDAVPKFEKRSKYGNMAFYNVFGKRYYVMPTCKNYEEKGIASWYGTQFHAQRTSSGERYNMLAMTAAHKTLPLPTYVQVTNLKNGKKVIVKVNDRGPFEANRIIDLSYVAAKKLGMLGHGTAYVKVKAIIPLENMHGRNPVGNEKFTTICSTKNLRSLREIHPGSGLYLKVGSFKSQFHAESYRNHLKSILAAPVQVEFSNHLYHVEVGPIEDNAKAAKIHRRLIELKIIKGKRY